MKYLVRDPPRASSSILNRHQILQTLSSTSALQNPLKTTFFGEKNEILVLSIQLGSFPSTWAGPGFPHRSGHICFYEIRNTYRRVFRYNYASNPFVHPCYPCSLSRIPWYSSITKGTIAGSLQRVKHPWRTRYIITPLHRDLFILVSSPACCVGLISQWKGMSSLHGNNDSLSNHVNILIVTISANHVSCQQFAPHGLWRGWEHLKKTITNCWQTLLQLQHM